MTSKFNIFLILFSVCFLVFSIVGFAAITDTKSFVITGTVPAVCNLSINTQGSSTNNGYNISDLTSSLPQTTIANVTENCNNSNGYTVSLTSANTGTFHGQLKDPTSQNTLDYTIYYNGSPISSTNITTSNSAANISKNLGISYNTVSSLTPSTGYTDTLNFTISTN